MARTKKSFPPELLEELRVMPVVAALDALGLYWKHDPDFVPVKDKSTVRLNVALVGGGVELLATGPKWYDTRAEKGGGGAVDLAMYLLRLDFVTAVKRFQSNCSKFSR